MNGLPLAREAWRYVVPLALIVAVCLWLWPWWAAVLPAALLLFVTWFFRDPERRAPDDRDVVVAPADGRIIRAADDRVSIFMNVFNVHVCRAPVSGTVESVESTPGRFLAAFKDSAPEHNERTAIRVAGEHGPLTFVLIAGLVARRIVCKVGRGQRLGVGERVGLIQFGSRVDVHLPAGAAPSVAVGDRVVAGETVIGRFAAGSGGSAPGAGA
jgi:phosphatidylserine decarboxylase